MGGGDKDGLGRDAVHVDERGGLEVVQMQVAESGHHVNAMVLFGDVHGDREILRCLRGEVDVRHLLAERRSALRASARGYLDDMQLRRQETGVSTQHEAGQGAPRRSRNEVCLTSTRLGEC